MMHTYSLIHDDLPSLDNDDFRRGRPTNHKVFGESIAVLAGDALLNISPEFLLRELIGIGCSAEKTLEIAILLLQSSGHNGMLKGQAMDMENESIFTDNKDVAPLSVILNQTHDLKTGAIINFSCLSGLLSSNDSKLIKINKPKVESIAQKIGLLFQIVDDILDVTSSFADIGKTPGKDKQAGKLTYTNLHGMDNAGQTGKKLIKEIRHELNQIGKAGENLILQVIIDSLEKKISLPTPPL